MLKLVLKWSRLTALALLTICLIFGTAVAPAHAQGPPGIPCQFYGYAYINGSLAANGKVVTAKINGVQVGTTACATATGYNYNFSFSGGTDGDTVVFFVDGVQATPPSVYHPGFFNGSSAPNQPPFNLYTYTSTLGVSTGTATGIFSTAAVLAGTLTGLGASPTVNVSFDYGLTTSYGTTTPVQPMTAAGGFTAGITGLTPGTTYHFRAKVTDGASTVNGLDAYFTTPAPVLTVVTGSATGITASTATLMGTLSDLGSNSGVNVSFDYGLTASYGGATSVQSKASTGTFSATVSGLTAGTTYHFRAKGTGGSSTVYGSDVTFTTSSQTGGCSSSCCHWFWGTAYLNGSAVTSGTVAGLVNGVQVATTTVNTSGGYNFYVPVTAGAPVTFTVAGVTAAQSTTGQCMGYNGSYNLYATTGTVSVSTGSSTYATASTAILNGTLGSLGSDSSATVSLEYGTSTAYGSTTSTTTMSSTGTFTGGASGLTAGTTYYFRAKAVGSPSGTIVYGSAVSFVHNSGGTLSVTTGSGSYLTTTTATLTSTLAGLASDTSATCYIDYGLTTSYGSSAGGSTLTSTGAYSGTATGLVVGQTYHIRGRVVGSPSGTTAYGSDVTYVHSSGGGSLAVTTGSGSYLTATTATLTGTLTGKGTDTSATCYTDYGLTTSYGSSTTGQVLTSTGSYSGSASGLVAGQTYHLRARAVGNPSGSTVYGSDVTYVHSIPTTDPIGSTAGTSATWGFANRAYFCKYTASSTTNITRINVYFVGAGNAKVAIYSDSSGMLDSLLAAGEGTATGAGIKTFTIATTPIVSGTSYWLAAWSDSPIISFAKETGTVAYFDQAAPFTFPSPITFIIYAGTINWRGMISAGN